MSGSASETASMHDIGYTVLSDLRAAPRRFSARSEEPETGAEFAEHEGAMTIEGHEVLVDPAIKPLMRETLEALEDAGREDLSDWVADRLRLHCGSARLLCAEPTEAGLEVRFNPWVELALLEIRDAAVNYTLSPREQRRVVRCAIHKAGL
jgi:hypothetical protein